MSDKQRSALQEEGMSCNRRSRLASYVCSALLLAQMLPNTSSDGCKDSYSILGMMLKGHIIKTMKTSISLDCLRACNEDVRCQSFNYVMMQSICELNNSTKEAKPEYLAPSPDRYYITVKDVDECIQGTHDCLADVATCTNTFGFYSCACNHGFKGDGKTSCKQGWLDYTPEWCGSVDNRRTIRSGVTEEECKQLCANCAAIEYWAGSYGCYECLDHTKRTRYTITNMRGYPPHVFVRET